ncbi:hypothetical protein [Elizabethkingia anophelis]|uniref:DUF1281 family ferredoxin-like fold protein n=1 Tax=Elizabethkingia anophelis TaxID=1117645 RepID=UPI0012B18BF8|nr:hypothetical protein [Elizabethkingia anophelis]QGN22506.1 hypothetical protein GJV56_07645 [Elizabethkingia anophelis]QNV09158.1 hypothetical protein EIY88_07625 [Elizabethkingia anophelis]UTF90914.1 hypothetical protein J2N93_07690 [Elizabethkingia anophelis]UTG01784.1 hypothetical protein J2O04_07695 [Elizabethkingia anophelis]UTG05534.1 hypothetical protein J2O03_07690 [Elizabethkingia anophelis]
MENWCSNFVQFSGDSEALREIEWLFRAMYALERETGQGQQPPFIAGNDGNIHQIDFFDRKIYFETPSVPNIDLLVQVADRYGVDFSLDYHELGCSVFGEADYVQGNLTDIRLDVEDFERFTYDLQEQAYVYEGLFYGSDAEILEIMLEFKKEQLNNPPGLRR